MFLTKRQLEATVLVMYMQYILFLKEPYLLASLHICTEILTSFEGNFFWGEKTTVFYPPPLVHFITASVQV